MSIRPVTTALPAPPPAAAERQGSAVPTPPPAQPQAGAMAVSGTNAAPAEVINGTKPANYDRAAPVAGLEAGSEAERQRLMDAVAQAQTAIQPQGRDISFSVHEKTGDVVVRIIDRESKEVIRQIPAEEMLRIAERLLESDGGHRPGLLLKQEA